MPIPSPILNMSRISQEDLGIFRDMLEANRHSSSPLIGVAWIVFHNLLEMSPNERLVRNLQFVLAVMADGPIESIMQDGVSASEKEALVALERLGVTQAVKETAQALLNINERYQLSLALRKAFT